MKIKRSTLTPLILTVYFIVMAVIGYPEFEKGNTSGLQYFGTILVMTVILILLHLNLKKRERLREEREKDIENNKKQ